MRRVLITGASGLIGELVIANLSAKYAFSGLSRRPVAGIPHLQADIADLDAIRPAFRGMDAVLHLAAETSPAGVASWEMTMPATIMGTINMYRAAAEAGVKRVVFMSSGCTMLGYEWDEQLPYGKLARGEYGSVAPGWPLLDHLDPPRPDSPYGVGKLFGEDCGRYFAERFGMSVLCIRLGAVLREDKPRLLRHFPGFLAQSDALQIIDKCLDAPDWIRFDIVEAISQNKHRWRSTRHATELLGWIPTGTADRFNPDDYL